jgi:hypothetical protein
MPFTAFEQGHARVVFEPGDLHARGRLRHVAPLRGVSEMPLPANAEEIFKLSDRHERILQRLVVTLKKEYDSQVHK